MKVERGLYFNIAPRMITPKRLIPPKPMTIALSDELALLQNKCLSIKRNSITEHKIQRERKKKNLNCNFSSLKNFSIPPTQSVHLLPTYSFLPLLWEEAVRCRDGNLYRIFPYTNSFVIYKGGSSSRKKFNMWWYNSWSQRQINHWYHMSNS